MKRIYLAMCLLSIQLSSAQSKLIDRGEKSPSPIEPRVALPIPEFKSAEMVLNARLGYGWPIVCGAQPDVTHVLIWGIPALYDGQFYEAHSTIGLKASYLKGYFNHALLWAVGKAPHPADHFPDWPQKWLMPHPLQHNL